MQSRGKARVGRSVRRGFSTVVCLLLAMLGANAAPARVAATRLPPAPPGHRIAVPSRVAAVMPHRADLDPGARTTTPPAAAVAKPFLTSDPARVAAAKASPRGVTANRTLGLAAAAGGTQSDPGANVAGPFPGVSHDFQLGNGLDGDLEPPDTQVAAGPSNLIEMVNSTVVVFDKAGNPVAVETLENFFDFAHTTITGEKAANPRIFFDRSTGRWIVAGLGFAITAQPSVSSDVLAAVSVDANPFDGFFVFDILRLPNFLCDQLGLGVSGAMVSVSCDMFDSADHFVEAELLLLDKKQMMAGAITVSAEIGSVSGFGLTPTLTADPNGQPNATIVTYNRRLVGVANQIAVLAFAGPVSNPTETEFDLTIRGTTVPPDAQQPGDGATGSIVTNDDRFLSSAWNGRQLWVAGNEGCLDTGRNTIVSCLKMVDVDTSAWNPDASTGAPTVAQDLDVFGGGGFHLFYPAVTLDSGGDPYVAFSESSTAFPVTFGTFTIPQCGSNFANKVVQYFPLPTGSGRYNDGARWGDYSGAAADPGDPNKLWLGGELTVGSGTRQWGTAEVELPVSTAVDSGRPYTGGHDAIGVTAGATDWFFAEGYTGANFDEFLTVQNPGAAQTMCVDYLLQDGTVISRSYNLAASSRTTLRVNDEVPSGESVSMHVHAADPIVAERPMYFLFNGQWSGGDDVMGATSLGSTFYFAEGFTGANFTEFLTLMNIDATGTSFVDVTYFFGGGALPKTVSQVVAPHSRVTVDVNDPTQAGPGQNVSMLVQVVGGPKVLAERPMYFNFNGWTGGHVAMGASALSTQVDLAEGFVSNNFDEFLTILNPNASVANVTITYNLAGGGTPVVENMTVPANSRGTRLVNGDLPGGTSASVHVDSNVGVVVERPMYFDFNGWTGGHDAVAVDSSTLGSTYNFAEGFAAGNFDEFLTVENNNTSPVTISITYFLAGGGGPVTEAPVSIPAHSRYTRFVNSDLPSGAAQSVQVTSTGGSVLVERPMYFAF